MTITENLTAAKPLQSCSDSVKIRSGHQRGDRLCEMLCPELDFFFGYFLLDQAKRKQQVLGPKGRYSEKLIKNKSKPDNVM